MAIDRPLAARTPVAGLAATRQARSAIAEVASRLSTLHGRVRFITASALHARVARSYEKLLAECDEIGKAISEARTELIVNLMDAPSRVAGHSRVVDVEKSLDSLERALSEARRALRQH